ncbi:hypothetical protein ACFPMF_19660 [Larkinella bovis]|uniref:Uncharacterized protein n=1 Tax=Larkinella bovis TaxID=683041 RepID=A0ABW0IK67_9BACT
MGVTFFSYRKSGIIRESEWWKMDTELTYHFTKPQIYRALIAQVLRNYELSNLEKETGYNFDKTPKTVLAMEIHQIIPIKYCQFAILTKYKPKAIS